MGKFFKFIEVHVPTILAVVLGLAAFQWHSALPDPNSSWAKLLEHLGVAFWVTGIVILLYEYGAKEKEVHRSLGTLNKLIKEQAEKNMDTCFDLLFKDDEGKRPDHLLKSRENLTAIVTNILELQKKTLWAKDKYIEFLNYLLTDVVLRNASNLVEISRKGNKSFHVPSAADMADRILAAQIGAMEKGYTYDVISDLGSWQNNQLSKFREETEKRVRGGVQVRRVFNIIRLDRIIDRMVSYDNDISKINDIRKILNGHLADSNDWGMHDGQPNYEIKVIGKVELDKSEFKKYLEEMEVKMKHFGLFNHSNGAVQFNVTRPNLSDMTLSADPDSMEGDRAVFHAVWNHASSPLTKERIEQIISELEFIVSQRHTIERDSAEIHSSSRNEGELRRG